MLAGLYWTEVAGRGQETSVVFVRTVGVAWLAFAAVIVPVWITVTTSRHRATMRRLSAAITDDESCSCPI